jgi:hypothetical protein
VTRHRLLLAALGLLVVLTSAEFVVRGPVRFLRHGNERSTDLAGPYLGARALVRGLNPYSSAVFWDMAEEQGWGVGRTAASDDFESHSPYPVTTFALLAPLALFPYPAAHLLAAITSAALVLLAIVALVPLAGFTGDDAVVRRRLLLGLALGLAPIHSALGTGNLVADATALTVLGAWFLSRERDIVAGLCLAVAACIKPPIAAPVLGYALLRLRWRTLGAAAAESLLILGVTALRLHDVPWLHDYFRNNALLLANDGLDVIRWSTAQQQFINLQYLGFYLFDQPKVVSLFAYFIGGVFLAVWLLHVVRRRRQPLSILDLASGVVISLLPIYHRVYDASLLLLPLAWALSEGEARTWRHRVLVLACLVPFLAPGGTWLEMQAGAGRIPDALTHAWWWHALVMPHQVWALLVMSTTLLLAQAAEARDA